MITAINKDNASKYTALFGKATSALRAKGEITDEWSITDLESYFSVIKQLLDIDVKYTVLPLDENYFSIDANSRMITVPADFKKNGIAVQGDEVAEIVYFKINRYFDFTDLNNTEIYIQWEQAGNIANPNSGVSKEWVRDIESDPDYLIFGWPLDSTITESAGPIRFSVRFIQWGDEDANGNRPITYNFSTLDATATINPALDFEVNELIVTDSINDMIKKRLKNTTPSGGSTADMPIYTLALVADTETNLGEGGKYTLKVQAYSPDAGILTYSWKIVSLNDGSSRDVVGDYAYEEITDKTLALDPNKLYYAKNVAGNGDITYSVITVSNDDKTIGDLKVANVYEKFAILEATGVGKYYAVATNRVNASTKENVSGPVIIPAPGASTFNPNGGNNLIMLAENDYKVVLSPDVSNITTSNLTYQWLKNEVEIDGANAREYEIVGDGMNADLQGRYTLKVTANLNNADTLTTSAPFNVTYTAATPIVTDKATNGVVTAGNEVSVEVSYENDYHQGNNSISYQWYYANVEGAPTSEISGATSATYITKAVDSGKPLICKVTNTYNDTTAFGYSNLITVVSV